MKMKLSMVILGLMVSASAFAGSLPDVWNMSDTKTLTNSRSASVVGVSGASAVSMPRDIASGVEIASPQILIQQKSEAVLMDKAAVQ